MFKSVCRWVVTFFTATFYCQILLFLSRYLLQNGTDPQDGLVGVHLNSVKMLELLLDHGAKLGEYPRGNKTALSKNDCIDWFGRLRKEMNNFQATSQDGQRSRVWHCRHFHLLWKIFPPRPAHPGPRPTPTILWPRNAPPLPWTAAFTITHCTCLFQMRTFWWAFFGRLTTKISLESWDVTYWTTSLFSTPTSEVRHVIIHTEDFFHPRHRLLFKRSFFSRARRLKGS